MTINELESILQEKKIPKDAYSLNGGLPNDAFCISQVEAIWQAIIASEDLNLM